jgi:hypothetical protein
MPALNVLVDLLSKVLFHDRDLAKALLGIWLRLYVVKEVGQKADGVVLGVSDEEGKVDEVVRVGEVLQVGKEHAQMRRGVSEGSAEKDPLLPFPSSGSALHVGEIVVPDRFQLEILDGRNKAQREDWEESGAERRKEEEEYGGEAEA